MTEHKAYTKHDPPPRTAAVDCSESPSRTKQSFAQEADINFIMARYRKTGFLVDPSSVARRQAMFLDLGSPYDYLEVQNRIAAGKAAFEGLPADVRDRFGNSVPMLLDFLADPANRPEAEKLGLLSPKASGVVGGEGAAPAGSTPAAEGGQ